ncbi:hypothetical protein [Leptospira weilii]|uniref:hypothetical protein n=1 Tax=Leptospira weilii TaxID=28184 RepID=UPI0012BA92D2|nr:hypothetical protein [Leptospira weilii]
MKKRDFLVFVFISLLILGNERIRSMTKSELGKEKETPRGGIIRCGTDFCLELTFTASKLNIYLLEVDETIFMRSLFRAELNIPGTTREFLFTIDDLGYQR